MCFTTRAQHGSLCFPTAQTFDRNHSTHDLELVVMVFALKVRKHYLYRVPYKIYTANPIRLVFSPKFKVYRHSEGAQHEITKLAKIFKGS